MRKNIMLVLTLTCALLTGCGSSNTVKYPYVQEYVAGESNIKGNVNTEKYISISEDFEIGANKYGFAVFKNPKKAFAKMEELYADGIKLIQKDYDLDPLSEENYDVYKNYGWQVSTGNDEERAQAKFISSFLDIYENSFERK